MAKPWDLKADLFICFVEEGSCIIAPMHPSLAGVLIFKETFICAFQFHPKQFDAYVLFAAFSHADDGFFVPLVGEFLKRTQRVYPVWGRLPRLKDAPRGTNMPGSIVVRLPCARCRTE